MKTASFYRTASGKCPVKEHLDSLTDVQATKIAWVLKLIRELDQIPSKYFKKLVKTNDIWEARVDVGRKAEERIFEQEVDRWTIWINILKQERS